MKPFPHDEETEDQAALWAAKLDGSTLSKKERAELDAWLAAKPEHRAVLSQYCQFSADLEEQLPALVAAEVVSMPAEKLAAQPKSRRAWILSFSTLAVAAAAAVAFVLWPAGAATHVQNIASAVAHRSIATLADGTRVELNARTTLLVEQGEHIRRVRLASGEAFFSVVKDPSRPFIVETPAGSVQVTGTRFNVRSESSTNLEVTVEEGSVQVRPGEQNDAAPSAPVSLKANDRLTRDAGALGVKALTSAEVENHLAWRNGKIVFEGVTLAEALSRFAHYHGKGISATSDAAGLHIGGLYSLDDLEGFFSAIEEILPVRVTHDSSGTVRVERRHEN
jgi:transmembrane sensor